MWNFLSDHGVLIVQLIGSVAIVVYVVHFVFWAIRQEKKEHDEQARAMQTSSSEHSHDGMDTGSNGGQGIYS
jgi:hypothetical protein